MRQIEGNISYLISPHSYLNSGDQLHAYQIGEVISGEDGVKLVP